MEVSYCGKSLTNDEYNRAIEEFRLKAEEGYKEQQNIFPYIHYSCLHPVLQETTI
jgi:hypothetical protein